MTPTSVHRLLRGVSARAYLASLGVAFYRALLVTTGLFGLLMLAAKLLGVIPNWYTLKTLPIVLPVAFVAALIFARRTKTDEAARLVDRKIGAKDLFLTTTLIGNSAGEYQPLVTRDAEERARGLDPASVVTFNPWSRLSTVGTVIALVALLAAIQFQFDPFGASEERLAMEKRKDEIKNERQQIVKKLVALQEKKPTEEHSKAIAAAVEELKQTLNKMDPQKQQENQKRLQLQQKQIADMWKARQDEQTKDKTDGKSLGQRFGGQNPKMQEWKQSLEKGDTGPMKEELKQVAETIQKMNQTSDPAQKQALKKEAEQKLQDLAEFASDQAGSKATADALKQAAKQLNMSDMQGLSEEAKQAMQEAMNLSQAELEQLAQSARDMKSLEEAMKTVRAARAANQKSPLDGSECEGGNCDSLADYQELYNKIAGGGAGGEGTDSGMADAMKQMADSGSMGNGGFKEGDAGQQGNGGMGGPGQGQGGNAPENPAAERGFQAEMSPSKMVAGKILMQMKTQGQAEKGEVKQRYQEAIHELKQNVSEAMLTENIAPGDEKAVQRYFSEMNPDTVPLPTREQPAKDAPAAK